MEFIREFLGVLREEGIETYLQKPVNDYIIDPSKPSRLTVTSFLVCVTLILVTISLWRRRQCFLVFKSLGIDGPTPNILIGNLKETKDGMSDAIQDWAKQYGRTFGFFEGPLPVMATSDVDILKHVFITEHAKFAAKKPFPVGDVPDGEDIHIAFAQGQRWKKQRDIMSPFFTAKNIKQMFPDMEKCAAKFLKQVEGQRSQGKSIDIYRYLQSCTLEVICRVGFGLDCDAMEFESFLRLCKECFKACNPEKLKQRPMFMLSVILGIIFPSMKKYWHKMQQLVHNIGIDVNPSVILEDALKGLIEERKKEKCCRGDFLQLLLEASRDESEKDVNNNSSPLKGKRKLETGELYANSTIFLLAGYDTTSTTMAFTAHELALHPDIQVKVQEEIDNVIPDKEPPTYEQLKELHLLDRVISEVLRLHPIAPSGVTRMCLEETTVKGMRIPRGLSVIADVRTLHSDPQYWGENPEEFNSDRFLPQNTAKRPAVAYLPFGMGPRHCVGMRFAKMEIKYTLVRLLQKYTIVRCEETAVPLDVREAATMVMPRNGVHVKLDPRD